MKTLIRIAAGLSSSFLFLSGAVLLAASGFRISGEYVIITALGLFLIGTACFVGPFLWFVAEKWASKPDGR